MESGGYLVFSNVLWLAETFPNPNEQLETWPKWIQPHHFLQPLHKLVFVFRCMNTLWVEYYIKVPF